MDFVLRTAGKDLLRRLADPPALVLWIAIPLLVGGLLSLLAGDGGPPVVELLVADRDQTLVSGLVTDGPLADRAGEGLELVEVTEEEGRRRIEAGEATGLVILPEGFSDAVLLGEPAELQLVTNPSQRILPAVAREGLEIMVEAVFYLRRLAGEPLAAIATGPPEGAEGFSAEALGGISASIQGTVLGLREVAFPPRIELVRAGGQDASDFDFGRLFLPGLLFMSLLFIAQGVSDDLWSELEAGTLRRIATAPRSLGAFLVGKLLGGAGLVAVVSVAGLALGWGLFDVASVRLPGAFAWTVFTGTALVAFFYLIQTFAASARGGSLLSSVVVFPLIMIGGSFFPFASMPEWMAAVGRWTPNGLAVVRLTELLDGTADVRALLLAAVVIGVTAGAAWWWTVRRVRSRLLRP